MKRLAAAVFISRIGPSIAGRVLGTVFIALLSACGGDGGGTTSPQAAEPSSPGITITPNSGLISASLGDEEQRLFVLPGEVTERLVRIVKSESGLTLTATITRGDEFLTISERDGRYYVRIDATDFRAGESRAYTLTLRGASATETSEVRGTIEALRPVAVVSGQITELGGTLQSANGDLRIEFDPKPGTAALTANVVAAAMPSGGRRVRIYFDRDVSNDSRVVRIADGLVAAQVEARRLGDREPLAKTASAASYPISHAWNVYYGFFTQWGDFRFDATATTLAALSAACEPSSLFRNYVCYDNVLAAGVLSTAPLSSTVAAGKEAVLFVHGYTASIVAFGGGYDTWAELPRMVSSLDPNRYLAFEFKWKTNTRLELASDDLRRAILEISSATGTKVTVVAHSFGGVLVRTLLQRLSRDKTTDWSQRIRQVVTLGTPHAGIFDGQTVRGTSVFQSGQDSVLFKGCDQTSCYQMGEGIPSLLNSPQLMSLLGVNSTPGEIAEKLADTTTLPWGIPIGVGIGLALDDVKNGSAVVGHRYRTGDALISLKGQRFGPRLTGSGSTDLDQPYLACSDEFGPRVEEYLLGNDGRKPGLSIPPSAAATGYGHNVPSLVVGLASPSTNRVEAYVTCSVAATCEHDSFRLVRRALEDGICTPPSFLRQPASATATTGQSVTFSVAVSGTKPMTYRWRRNGQDIPGSPNASTLSIPIITLADDGAIYSVVVSNSAGSATSDSATLRVSAGAVLPAISSSGQPQGVTVTAGQTATFTVTATGTGPLSYQWRKNGVNVPCASGTNCPSYTTPPTTLADDGAIYSVVVSNSAGSATSDSATLRVSAGAVLPAISSSGQPQGVTVTAGQTATFTVTATGTGPLTYQWRRNGVNVPCSSATNCASYTTPPTTLADSGAIYSVVVSNSAGSTISANATLTVTSTVAAPTITQPPQSTSTTEGRNAAFSVSASGSGLAYQWRINGAPIVIDGSGRSTQCGGGFGTSGVTSSTLSLTSVPIGCSGAVFSVTVSNSAGAITSSGATLTVNSSMLAPVINFQPADTTVGVGQSATFSVSASDASPSGEPSGYQWLRGGVAIAGATLKSYTTPPTTLADNGAQFSVVVSNAGGSVTSRAATLTVTNVSPGAGYYLVAEAGPYVEGANLVVWANTSERMLSASLVAVSTGASPSAVILEPGGQWGALGNYGDAYEATVAPSTRLYTDLRKRFTTYVKNGRFYKFDHDAGSGGPVGVPLSTQAISEVCQSTVLSSGLAQFFDFQSYEDFADPTRSYLVYTVAGPDQVCGSADDGYRAIRFGMTGSDSPLVVPKVILPIFDAVGAISGFVVNANGYKRVDANFASPVPLSGIGSIDQAYATGFGASAPGYMIYASGATVYAYDLAGPSGPTALFSVTAGEALQAIESDASAFYVALRTSTSGRVIRVDNALNVQTLVSQAVPIDRIALTPTRVIFSSSSVVQAVPISGGAATLVAAVPLDYSSALIASGENVYIDAQTYAGSTRTVRIARSDGSAVQDIINGAVVNRVIPSPASFFGGYLNGATYAVLIAEGWTAASGFAGSQFRSYEGATRSVLVTYGGFPANPAANVTVPSLVHILPQFGQPSLVSFQPWGGLSAGDLFAFKTDAPGLTRVTNFVSSQQALISRGASSKAVCGEGRPCSAAVPLNGPGRPARPRYGVFGTSR